MANKKIWLGIPVIVLVFGMTVTGCATTSDPGSPPVLTGLYAITYEASRAGDKTPITSFPRGYDSLQLRIDGNDPDGDFSKLFLTIKRGNEVIDTSELDIANAARGITDFGLNPVMYTRLSDIG